MIPHVIECCDEKKKNVIELPTKRLKEQANITDKNPSAIEGYNQSSS